MSESKRRYGRFTGDSEQQTDLNSAGLLFDLRQVCEHVINLILEICSIAVGCIRLRTIDLLSINGKKTHATNDGVSDCSVAGFD